MLLLATTYLSDSRSAECCKIKINWGNKFAESHRLVLMLNSSFQMVSLTKINL
jgi:hypothetical protein